MKRITRKYFAILLGMILAIYGLNMVAVNAAEDEVPDVTLTTTSGGGISQSYVIKSSNPSQAIDLSKIVLRYYYDKSGTKQQQFCCDNAGLSINMSPYYVDYSKNVKGTFYDGYLEISMTDSYSLNDGRLSLGVRFNQNDWSSYENFKEKKLEVVYDGELVNTITYSSGGTSTTAPTKAPTSAPTTEPTRVPTTAPTSTPTVKPSATPAPTAYIMPPVNDIEKDGPYAVTMDKNVGPNGDAWVARPTNMCTLGVKAHPIYIWGPGGGGTPAGDEWVLKRMASHGLVVYCAAPEWSGEQAVAGLNWIVQQNENANSPLYQKLDVTRIAAGGFSLGSMGAWAVADDPRISTTIHVDGGSLDGAGASKMRKPTCLICGLADNLALGNTQRDYAGANVPIWFGGIIGGDHGSGPANDLGPMVAWLRWQLAGETQYKSMFIGNNAKYNTGIWKSEYKNW